MSTLDRDATVVAAAPARGAAARVRPGLRSVAHVMLTLLVVAIAATLGAFAWRAYMGTPWTRDGTVRAYVVSIAPQVAGQIVQLPVRDNQLVHKGDLLMQIDPASYAIAVRQAQAAVKQAKALAENADAEWARRQKLNDLAVTLEEQQTYASKSLSALAQYQSALADLDTARLNLERTRIVSPVNGYVTNLQAQTGDYANVGARTLAVIDADSYWVDAYFEETFLPQIHDGDAARVKFMGYPEVLHGRVQSVSRGISVPNDAPSGSGLAEVNPVFTFVRLAQRIPVRIHLEAVPADLRLVAGMTATVTIEPGDRAAAATEPAQTTRQVATTGSKSAVAPAGADTPSARADPVETTARSTAALGAANANVAPSSASPAVLGPADAGAAAILPPLPGAPPPTAAAAAVGAPSPLVKAPSPSPSSPAVAAAAPAPPPAAPPDAATAEATQLLADEAFDRTLVLEPTSQPPPQRHAPETLRRRGWRHWQRR